MVVNCAAMALHDRAGTELMDQHHAVGLQNGEEFVLIINQQTGTRTKVFFGTLCCYPSSGQATVS